VLCPCISGWGECASCADLAMLCPSPSSCRSVSLRRRLLICVCLRCRVRLMRLRPGEWGDVNCANLADGVPAINLLLSQFCSAASVSACAVCC
jgi:hypothetical protein